MEKQTLRGIYPIVPTPFDEDGALDVESIARMTAFMCERGVAGLAVLGVMGEADKLTEAERLRAVRAFREALPRDRHLVVGAGAPGTMAAIEAARAMLDLGADALLVAPPPTQNDQAIFGHYEQIARALAAPIVIHDYPASTGILLSPELLARLGDDAGIGYVKLEEAPTGPKMARLAELSRSGMMVFGALGGQYALEELERGAVGIMTGFAYPELLVRLFELHAAGDRESAEELFFGMLPLVRFEFQPKLGISLRKHILVQRGAIRHTAIRRPGMSADAVTLEQLERILAHLRRTGILPAG
ncbi:MAG TPA: dihydrodipicolinate synthase family protein [Candidatus Dormibacteraeota bacterium]|nr:dihydrodipicolinate synthase family protein [Candidatus Dormibacteraeota bacterium]